MKLMWPLEHILKSIKELNFLLRLNADDKVNVKVNIKRLNNVGVNANVYFPVKVESVSVLKC